jgi:uncharacterized protein YutE (UPF0331/DUF86 family)
MTPKLLNQKIESLRHCIERIESKTPFTLEEIESNFDLQDIISINLERATQICVDIGLRALSDRATPSPNTMAETFTLLAQDGIISADLALALRKSVGLRNMLVHEYSKIDWRIIHDVCHHHLSTYRNFAIAIAGAIKP